jgi:hypothetical protein
MTSIHWSITLSSIHAFCWQRYNGPQDVIDDENERLLSTHAFGRPEMKNKVS